MQQAAHPHWSVRNVVISFLALIGAAFLADAATGFSAGLGLDVKKHSETLGIWIASLARTADVKVSEADRAKCEADNKNALFRAKAHYRRANDDLYDCNGKYVSNDAWQAEMQCSEQRKLLAKQQARLDGAKSFTCDG